MNNGSETVVQQRLEKVEVRVDTLEEFVHQYQVHEAARDERGKAMAAWMESIDAHIKKSTDNSTWLVRLVIGGLILAFIGFIVAGGLATPKP